MAANQIQQMKLSNNFGTSESHAVTLVLTTEMAELNYFALIKGWPQLSEGMREMYLKEYELLKNELYNKTQKLLED